ncbi:hypothetical protein CH063_12840, partial [Colletotrichum higginsianum]
MLGKDAEGSEVHAGDGVLDDLLGGQGEGLRDGAQLVGELIRGTGGSLDGD